LQAVVLSACIYLHIDVLPDIGKSYDYDFFAENLRADCGIAALIEKLYRSLRPAICFK
jgi:hypothetical protein